jgi:hypothetical protein
VAKTIRGIAASCIRLEQRASKAMNCQPEGPEMEELIEVAFYHAKYLRDYAHTGDDQGARVTEEEAELWERLATMAQAELLALRSSQAAT